MKADGINNCVSPVINKSADKSYNKSTNHDIAQEGNTQTTEKSQNIFDKAKL